MKYEIPLAKPYFDEQEHIAVSDVLNSGMVSQGKVVEEFEENVRRYTGARFACAMSSCTAGLYLITKIKQLYRTLIPAFTFPAMHSAVQWAGENYYFAPIDVDKNTYNLDINDLKERLESNTQYKTDEIDIFENLGRMTTGYKKANDEIDAIVPIHQFGLSCDMDEINKIAQERDLLVLEDAACALGSEYKGERIGKHGTIVFSFHGRKIITTGEGGMVCTDDEELYEKILEGRQFGRNSRGEFRSTGLNFKMSDVSAAIGIAQMEKLPEILSLRSFVAKTYHHLISEHNMDAKENEVIYLSPPFGEDAMNTKPNWQSYVVRLPSSVDRDNIIQKMKNANIECQVGSYDNSNGSCLMSSELARTTLALPIWPGMTEEHITKVVSGLESTINGSTNAP
jgi:dTDP-4-amino-4,6-dideoxygalactose transaminase